MPDSRDASLDRHLAGELSQSEQRALAQTALDDPELFDLLTTVAAVKAAVLPGGPLDAFVARGGDGDAARQPTERPSGRGERWSERTVPRRFSQRLTVGVGVAAAVVLTFVMLPRRPERPAPGLPAADRPAPGVPMTGAAARPRLLAPRLGEPAEPRSRGVGLSVAPEASRPPKQEGAIAALAGELATIELGSLDGLSKGMELPVVRGTPTPAIVDQLTVTTTSLERGQGRVAAAGTLRVGDRVRTAPLVYLSALTARVAASIADDDLPTARMLAEHAVTVVESDVVPADSRRAAFAQLAAVEYRSQALAEAERHYRSAQASLDAAPVASAPERARILNELGAVLIAQGNYPAAGEVLLAAQSAAGGTGSVAGQVANNLAALAELRGDPSQAALLYVTALGLVDGSQAPSQTDRSVIEKNLAALSR